MDTVSQESPIRAGYGRYCGDNAALRGKLASLREYPEHLVAQFDDANTKMDTGWHVFLKHDFVWYKIYPRGMGVK